MSLLDEITILVVEDDAGHARLIEKNLRRAGIGNPITKFGDGQRALDFVFEEGEFAGQRRPDAMLVLLDLNLPQVDGFGVLTRLKGNESTKEIPVIVLTSSENQADISRCYALGCNVFVSKPLQSQPFSEAINKLGLMLTVAAIPAR